MKEILHILLRGLIADKRGVNNVALEVVEVIRQQTTDDNSHQKMKEARNGFSLRAYGGSMALPTHRLFPRETVLDVWILGCERMNICCFSFQVCGHLF